MNEEGSPTYVVFKAQEVGRFNLVKRGIQSLCTRTWKKDQREVFQLLQIKECTTDAILFSFENREVHSGWGMVLIYVCHGLNLLGPESGTVGRCGPGGVGVSLWV